jgi:hypothetical protein
MILVGVNFTTPGQSTHKHPSRTRAACGSDDDAAFRQKEHALTTSQPPDSAGHRRHLRSSKLEDLVESDLYSAVLFAASDSFNAALSVEERAAASARKAAAMREIERREAPPRSRRTPPSGVSKTRSARTLR